MTTATGPGSPATAIRYAWWIASGISAWWWTSSTVLQTGWSRAVFASEWTWPIGAFGPRLTSVTMPTIGTLSSSASPMPVIALVSPGPGTTQKTPTAPVTRAEASAMTLADASLVTSR